MPMMGDQVGLSIDRVILATDFSPVSEAATSYAKGIAKHFASSLTVAHVIDLSVSTRSEQAVVGLPIDETRRNDNEKLENLLDSLAEDGVRATAQSLEARNPATAIVGLSQQLRADLIVLGTHSRHGLSKAILGSCAEGVIRHATCPVITIGPKVKPRSSQDDFAFKTIVFATDFDSDAAEKASVALTFAQDSAAKIYLCHTVERSGENVSERLRLQQEFESALQKLIPQSAYDWCTPECVVEQGEAAAHTLAFSKQVKADLIVIGARRSSSWFTHLVEGAVEHVLADAECPVMTICTT